jgi:hypothetical protein
MKLNEKNWGDTSIEPLKRYSLSSLSSFDRGSVFNPSISEQQTQIQKLMINERIKKVDDLIFNSMDTDTLELLIRRSKEALEKKRFEYNGDELNERLTDSILNHLDDVDFINIDFLEERELSFVGRVMSASYSTSLPSTQGIDTKLEMENIMIYELLAELGNNIINSIKLASNGSCWFYRLDKNLVKSLLGGLAKENHSIVVSPKIHDYFKNTFQCGSISENTLIKVGEYGKLEIPVYLDMFATEDYFMIVPNNLTKITMSDIETSHCRDSNRIHAKLYNRIEVNNADKIMLFRESDKNV